MTQSIQQTILALHETHGPQDGTFSISNEGGGEWTSAVSDEDSIQTHRMDIPGTFKYKSFETLHGMLTEVVYVDEMGDCLVVRSGLKTAFLIDRPRQLILKLRKAEKDVQDAGGELAAASARMFGEDGNLINENQDLMKTAAQNQLAARQRYSSVQQECIQYSVDEGLLYYQEEGELDVSDEYDEYGARIVDPSPAKRKNQITVSSSPRPRQRQRARSRSRSRDRDRSQRRRPRRNSRERERSRDLRPRRQYSAMSREADGSDSIDRRATVRRSTARYSRTPNPPRRISAGTRTLGDRFISNNLTATTRAISAAIDTANTTGDRLVEVGGQLMSRLLDGQDMHNSGMSRALETQELGLDALESILDHET